LLAVSILLFTLSCTDAVTKAQLRAKDAELDALQKQLNELTTNITNVNRDLGLTSRKKRSIVGTDAIYAMDATLTATTKCGAQDITGWTQNLDTYYKAGASTTSGDAFSTSTGIFTPPVAGYYNICGFARFQNSGNANDITIYKGSSVIAAFGDAIGDDWRSTGTCTIQSLATTDTIKLKHESTGGSDCIQETGWYYARFSVYLIINSA